MAEMTLAEKVEKLKKENPPSEQIKDRFEVVGVIPGPVAWKGKTYDLRKISLAKAEQLVQEGLPYLKEKVGTKPAVSEDKKK